MDAMDVVIALSRIQSNLRMLEAWPARYPPDHGHLEDIERLTAALESRVDEWMTGEPADRRHQDRRHQERRTVA